MTKLDNALIETASYHTLGKVKLVSEYARLWAYKLINYKECKKICFIDCMSNCGQYYDENGKIVEGTALRVARSLFGVSKNYPDKKICLVFNDIVLEKVNHLRQLTPNNTSNYTIEFYAKDANDLLKEMVLEDDTCYLLLYDPYKADIDWEAILPFFRSWSEVIINHMISDPIRVSKSQLKKDTLERYKKTYLLDFDSVPYGTNRKAYEQRIEDIIKSLKKKRRTSFIASFPFYNTKNALVYDLLHITTNLKGFKLFKKTAWKTFGGKSSLKDTKGKEDQLLLDFENDGYNKANTDENCYYIKDIADYIQDKYNSSSNVPIEEMWNLLDTHPVFPSDGFRKEIILELKNTHHAIVKRKTITFIDRKNHENN